MCPHRFSSSNCCCFLQLIKNELLSCEYLPPSHSSLPLFSALLPQPVMELRSLMEEVKTIKVEREVIETTLRDPVADIGKREGGGGRGRKRENEGGRGGRMREVKSLGTHNPHTLTLSSLTQLPSSCRL